MVWGDPHIVTFDLMRYVRSDFWREKHRNHDSRGHWGLGQFIVPDFFKSGDYWVVKSSQISIQGRYTRNGGYALRGLAFGGPFLDGHRLVIDRMWEGKASVTWDARSVGAHFRNSHVQVHLSYDRYGFKSGTVTLPRDVKVKLARSTWNHGNSATVDSYIAMRRQPG